MFIKIPANKRSLARRKLVCGVGVNDSIYIVKPVVNGVRKTNPAYETWCGMIKRCYCKKQQIKQPTYIGIKVCNEWLLFSAFEMWFEDNYVKGYELDKDIKSKGNKVYSPEMCMYVPKQVNTLLLHSTTSTGKYAMGVCSRSDSGPFCAQIYIDGKNTHIGSYKTNEEASDSYKRAKNLEIIRKSSQFPEFENYLRQHMYKLPAQQNNQ
jgi:hypothetical protein